MSHHRQAHAGDDMWRVYYQGKVLRQTLECSDTDTVCMHTILIDGRRWMPSLFANVLLPLSGGLLLLCLATQPTMGRADALSVLSRAESVLLLAEADSAKVSSAAVSSSACGVPGLGC